MEYGLIRAWHFSMSDIHSYKLGPWSFELLFLETKIEANEAHWAKIWHVKPTCISTCNGMVCTTWGISVCKSTLYQGIDQCE